MLRNKPLKNTLRGFIHNTSVSKENASTFPAKMFHLEKAIFSIHWNSSGFFNFLQSFHEFGVFFFQSLHFPITTIIKDFFVVVKNKYLRPVDQQAFVLESLTHIISFNRIYSRVSFWKVHLKATKPEFSAISRKLCLFCVYIDTLREFSRSVQLENSFGIFFSAKFFQKLAQFVTILSYLWRNRS